MISKSFSKVFFLSLVAALGGFLFGFDSGVINGTVSALQTTFNASSLGSGFNVASMLLGCAAGAFMAGRIADRFGRRVALIVAAILFAVSAWGSGISDHSIEFVIYRLIGGFAVGAASVISPAYISEIAPHEFRGRLAAMQQLAIVLGLFAAFLSNYLLASAAGGASETLYFGFQAWQWMFWLELVPVSLFFTGLLFIPESPRYLVARGETAKAQSVLASIAEPERAAEKVAQIQKTLKQESQPSLRDLISERTGKVHPVVWVGIIIASLQQFIGINVVFYYGEVLWKAAGYSEENALLINVIGGAINVGATVGAILLIDRWGRKPLLVMGGVIMAVFLTVLAIVFGNATLGPDGNLILSDREGIVALFAANLYLFGFGISWGPVMWVLLGEMFPNQVRGAALSVAGLSQWMSNFIVTITFPILLTKIGLGGAYMIYSGFALVAAGYAWKYVSETKGKTLEEMDY